jgi:hypothetical protein
MSNNGTRSNGPKPRPRPKTVEQWKETRRERYRSSGDKGGFRLLPVKVLDSDAFNELSKSAKIVLIISLSQLDYWHKKHKGLPRRHSSIGRLRNDGCFCLPNNLLIERGIKGTDTIARIRKELVAAGFWETVQTGSLYNSGVFRWSDNWLLYNQKPVAERKQYDCNALPAGFCHYPNRNVILNSPNQQKSWCPGLALVLITRRFLRRASRLFPVLIGPETSPAF